VQSFPQNPQFSSFSVTQLLSQQATPSAVQAWPHSPQWSVLQSDMAEPVTQPRMNWQTPPQQSQSGLSGAEHANPQISWKGLQLVLSVNGFVQ
jgi:hypothetical protein